MGEDILFTPCNKGLTTKIYKELTEVSNNENK